jgi:hypothetical protein
VNKIVKAAVEGAAEEAAGLVPGVSTAIKVVRAAFAKHAEARAEELFRCIGIHLGVGDPERAAEILEAKIGEDWFDEAIRQGFRDMMDCTDAEVRRCIGFLVAEYVVDGHPLDRKYRLVGGLFRRSDSTMLATLLSICDAYAGLLEMKPQGECVLIRGNRTPSGPTFFMYDMRGKHRSTYAEGVPENFDVCADSLIGEGLGAQWTGSSSTTFGGDPVARFPLGEDSAMALLTRCLRAWKATRPTGEDGHPSV